jgi:hypothetical protein
MFRTPSSALALIVIVSFTACSTQAPTSPTATGIQATGSGSLSDVLRGSNASVPAGRAITAAQLCDPRDPDHDVTGPLITGVGATPSTLWSPNHKWNDVRVNYNTSDPCQPVVCTLSISSNEPLNDIGDGNTAVDYQVVSDHQVRLRAERAGPRTGRVYTITIQCRDALGNLTTTTTTVTVAHDQGKK